MPNTLMRYGWVYCLTPWPEQCMAIPPHRSVAMYPKNEGVKSYNTQNFYDHPLGCSRTNMLPAIFKVLALSLAVLVYTMLFLDLITNTLGLAAYSLLLLGYLYAESRYLWSREK